MQCNGRVFISHAHVDNGFCDPLHAWLKFWGIECWYDRANMDQSHMIANIISQAIKERDILLRVCTAPAQRSFFVNLEREIFIALMAEDHRRGQGGKRKLINLLVDPNYALEPVDLAFVFIDATGKPTAAWLEELRTALLGAASTESVASSRPALPPNVEVDSSDIHQPGVRPSFSGSRLQQLQVAEFIDDDLGYLDWLTKHPGGFVLNCSKVPRPNYLMLHHAICHTISGTPKKTGPLHGTPLQGNEWTGAYMKACSTRRSDLEEWARIKSGGGKVRPCFFCKP